MEELNNTGKLECATNLKGSLITCFVGRVYILIFKLFFATNLKELLFSFTCLQAFYQVGILLVLNFSGTSVLSLKKHNREYANDVKDTVIFNAFVLCQVSHESHAAQL